MSFKYEFLKKLVVATGLKKAMAQRHDGRAPGGSQEAERKEPHPGFEGRCF